MRRSRTVPFFAAHLLFFLCLFLSSLSLSRAPFPNQTPWHLDDTRFNSPSKEETKRWRSTSRQKERRKTRLDEGKKGCWPTPSWRRLARSVRLASLLAHGDAHRSRGARREQRAESKTRLRLHHRRRRRRRRRRHGNRRRRSGGGEGQRCLRLRLLPLPPRPPPPLPPPPPPPPPRLQPTRGPTPPRSSGSSSRRPPWDA